MLVCFALLVVYSPEDLSSGHLQQQIVFFLLLFFLFAFPAVVREKHFFVMPGNQFFFMFSGCI